jgi:hypothetical protein
MTFESEPKDVDDLDDRGATPEVDDQPMGVPADADPDEAGLPGIPDPEKEEPPADG